MTVTKRKMKPRESAGDSAPTGPTLESGVKATCDACSADITHTVHVRCAERVGADDGSEGTLTCPDFDLCVDCFLHGKALGPHRPTHAYRIISSHSFPIFNRDWGADEELALIEGAQMYGLGNWADIAEHVGGRTKEECAEHYQRIYLESENYPLPTEEPVTSADVDSFPSRKAARLQELQSRPIPLPPPKPLASAPTCHELGGYMPGRLEFEHDWENEAEVLIKDMEFGKVYHFGGDSQPAQPPPPPAEGEEPQPEEKPLPDGEKEGDEPEAELDLKLTILDMFNERYDKRMAAKELIFDRGLINYKTMSAAERKRSKEERDLITRAKVFSRIQTAQDHEEFVEGMLYEITVRKRIAELQAFRRAGITTLAEAERYETARQQRLSSKAAYRDTLALSFGGSSAASSRRPTPQSQITASLRNRPPPPLTLATSSSLQLLTPLEQQLCSTLRILPRPYLFLKEVLLREWVRLKGRMGAREARRAVLREKNGELLGPEEGVGGEWGEKIERVWEFVRESAGLKGEEYSGVVSEEEDAVDEGDEEMKEVDQASGTATPMAVEV